MWWAGQAGLQHLSVYMRYGRTSQQVPPLVCALAGEGDRQRLILHSMVYTRVKFEVTLGEVSFLFFSKHYFIICTGNADLQRGDNRDKDPASTGSNLKWPR